MKNPMRTISEIELLSSGLGVVCCEPDDPSVVLIEQFELPAGYNKRYSELLIDLGNEYPLLPPKDWYLNKGLRRNGKKLDHYYENSFGSKEYCDEGFAWCSFHIKKWKPDSFSMVNGDNLLTAVNSFYDFLKSL